MIPESGKIKPEEKAIVSRTDKNSRVAILKNKTPSTKSNSNKMNKRTRQSRKF
jgi:hypothetical protein